jgi:Prokaryotic cytochrome b561
VQFDCLSPGGDPDLDFSDDPVREPALQRPASFSCDDVLSGALHSTRVGNVAVQLLFVQPLVGWAMLSAARYPIVLYGPLHLFPILPHSVMLYAALRKAHTVLAYLLFLAFIAHFGAVLFHTVILRDRLFSRIAPYRVPAR